MSRIRKAGLIVLIVGAFLFTGMSGAWAEAAPDYSRVIEREEILYWRDSGRGIHKSGMIYAQVNTPLTAEEIELYSRWKADETWAGHVEPPAPDNKAVRKEKRKQWYYDMNDPTKMPARLPTDGFRIPELIPCPQQPEKDAKGSWYYDMNDSKHPVWIPEGVVRIPELIRCPQQPEKGETWAGHVEPPAPDNKAVRKKEEYKKRRAQKKAEKEARKEEYKKRRVQREAEKEAAKEARREEYKKRRAQKEAKEEARREEYKKRRSLKEAKEEARREEYKKRRAQKEAKEEARREEYKKRRAQKQAEKKARMEKYKNRRRLGPIPADAFAVSKKAVRRSVGNRIKLPSASTTRSSIPGVVKKPSRKGGFSGGYQPKGFQRNNIFNSIKSR